MSSCHCEDSRHYRVTGEVWDRGGWVQTAVIGDGSKEVRVRCAECGGKVTIVGSNLLNALGIPDDEIVNGRCFDETEQVSVTVDLI